MGSAWGEALEAARSAELAQIEREWRANPADRVGPFVGKTLSGADAFWLAARALARDGGDQQAAEERLRTAQKDTLLRTSLDLSALDLRGAILSAAALQRAVLGRAHLEEATLGAANLQGAFLGGTHLKGAFLDQTVLEGAFLNAAHLDRASLYGARLQGATLNGAVLEDAVLARALLNGADLTTAHLARANFTRAVLIGAVLSEANLTEAILYEARLEGAILRGAWLSGADLRRASFDATSRLNGSHLDRVSLYEATFDRTSLTAVAWPSVRRLGDERTAAMSRDVAVAYGAGGRRVVKRGKRKITRQREEEYIAAARAYRSLSVELHGQGIVRDAARFHFRAEVMSRRASLHRALRHLRSPWVLVAPFLFVPWLLSLLLSVVAGYGVYHVWRLAVTYVVVVVGFAGAYFLAGLHAHAGLDGTEALLLSLTSFHGRGLQPSTSLTEAMRVIAGAEAVVGLLIEGLLIAAFTRRITGS